MKVIKDNDLSILFKPWGYGHQYYLHLTVVLGFDLLAPDTLLPEQDMWGKLPDVMGEDKILDESMPKMNAEFLVTGRCHAPVGQTLRAGTVSASVGSLEKRLFVFGNRHWRRNRAGMQVISDPEPFQAIDISYQNAFGGAGYDKNPAGKGFLKNGKDENGHRPLPNIELPDREIGAPSDRPEPAGFAPLDRMWPQRLNRTGTYDEEWKNTRWPYFPADMDYTFFNTAPADQWMDGYFTGNETFVLEGMHPVHQRIQNTLPPVRPRQFVYRKVDPKKGFEADNLIFEEAQLKLDTIWFFPEGLLGVLVFHGSVIIQDEEYLDVHRLYLTKEPANRPPESLSHYREKMLAGMDMVVPVDMAPFEEAAAEFESMLRQWRNIPKQIEDIKKRAMGKAPEMSYSPDETAAILKKAIAGGYSVIGDMENLARNMHSQYGHMAKIDLAQFDGWRKHLGEMERRIDETAAMGARIREDAEQAEKEAAKDLREQFTPEQLSEQGIDPDNLLEPLPADPWQAFAFSFAMQARKNLENDPEALEKLAGLGFESHTIEKYWMGIVHGSTDVYAARLGLSPEEVDKDPVSIPPGLVLPVFEGAETIGLCVRTGRVWPDGDEAFVLPGSGHSPVFIPACLTDNPPVVVIAEQMAALLIEQEAGDMCSVLWLPDTGMEPGEEAEEALEWALSVLVITGPGRYPGDLSVWAAQRDNATCLAIPDDHPTIFDARRQGLKIRSWILRALPEDFARMHDIEIKLPKAGDAPGNILPANLLPPMDIKGLIESAISDITAFYQASMGFDMEKMLDQAAGNFNMSRPELDAAMKKNPQTGVDSPADIGRRVLDNLRGEQEALRNQNNMTPEIEVRYRDAIARVEEMTAEADDLEARFEASTKELEEKKALLATETIPEEAAEEMRAAGLDPDRVRAVSRGEVIEIHGRGESLSMFNLSGLDLSGLDLSGADLCRTQCIGTRFAGTLLSGADLSEAMANEADFSGADMTGATAYMTMFSETVMSGVVCREASFKQAAFTDADLVGADFSGANLELVSFETCRADDASFADARLKLVAFNETTGKAMDFTGMHGEKCLFQDCVLDEANFSGTVLPATMFMSSRGEGVSFFEADLSRASICRESAFPGADFRHARMHESCIKDSDLSGSDLRKTTMDGSLFEGCDLTGACMRKMIAPRTRFNRVNLERADMRGVNLLTGSLRRSRLVNADLSSGNLYGADLYKAEFGGTNLEGTNLGLTLLAEGRRQHLE